MNRLAFALLFVCFTSLPCAGQSVERIAELDAYIAQAQKDWEVPGLAVAIVKDGNVVLAKGYGVRKVDTEESVDADTLFAIASNTKAFTAAAMAMLVEEKKLKWNDRVQEHLPYFQVYDHYASAEMRLEDLLCHRSGLGTFSGDLLWYGTDYTAEDIVRRTRYVPQAGPFRAHYGYSNLMFLAAGEVIESASKQTWSGFVRDRILMPLEMKRTVLSVKDLPDDNVAIPHKILANGDNRQLPYYQWDAMAAAGGIISSVNDMSQWIRLQLDEGRIDDNHRLFSDASSWRMWSAHTIIPFERSSLERYPSTHFRAYGLGWSLSDYKGRKTVSHGGGYDGMFSRVMLIPEEELGMVVLTNSMTGISSAITNRIADAYLGGSQRDWAAEGLVRDREGRQEFYERIAKAVTPVANNTRPSQPLANYAGRYAGRMYGDVTVKMVDDRLVLRLVPSRDLVAELEHLHYDTFVIKWRYEFAWFTEGTAQFVMDAAGQIQELKLDCPNDDFWFYELELKRVQDDGK